MDRQAAGMDGGKIWSARFPFFFLILSPHSQEIVVCLRRQGASASEFCLSSFLLDLPECKSERLMCHGSLDLGIRD